MSLFGNKDDAYQALLKTPFSYGSTAQMQADFLKGKDALLTYAKIHISKDCWSLLKEEQEVTYTPPTGTTGNSSYQDKVNHEASVKEHRSDVKEYQKNKTILFGVMTTMCTDLLKTKLQTEPDFSTWEKDDDVLQLLNQIKQYAYGNEETKYKPMRTQSLMWDMFSVRQAKDESLQ